MPPKRRPMLSSAWWNGLNRNGSRAGSMPTPESATWIRTRMPRSPAASPDASPSGPRWMWTPPVAVNLIALATRLATIWRIRVLSPRIISGTSGEQVETSSMPLTKASGAKKASISRTSAARCSGRRSSTTLPASSLEKSSTSLTRCISTSALCRCTSSRLARRASARAGWRSISVAPIMPCRGVRISWLTWVMKRALAAVAACAASRANSSARRNSLSQRVPSAAQTATNTADRLIDIAICSAGSAVSSENGPIEPGPRWYSRAAWATKRTESTAPITTLPAIIAPRAGTPSHHSAGERMPSWNRVISATIVNRSEARMSIARPQRPLLPA